MEENISGRCLTIGERARRMAQGDLRGSRVATCVKCAYTLSAPAFDSTCPMARIADHLAITDCPSGVRVRYTCSSSQVREYAQEGPLFLSLQTRQSLSVRPMRWPPDQRLSLTDSHGGDADSCILLAGCSDSPYSMAFLQQHSKALLAGPNINVF